MMRVSAQQETFQLSHTFSGSFANEFIGIPRQGTGKGKRLPVLFGRIVRCTGNGRSRDENDVHTEISDKGGFGEHKKGGRELYSPSSSFSKTADIPWLWRPGLSREIREPGESGDKPPRYEEFRKLDDGEYIMRAQRAVNARYIPSAMDAAVVGGSPR